jgi:hypothetical protein
MADVDYTESSSSNLVARINNDDFTLARRFVVEHNAGGVGAELFTVTATGVVTLYGRIHRNAPVEYNNMSAGDIAYFQAGGSIKAAVTGDGVGDFSSGGVRLLELTTLSATGSPGDLALYAPAGTNLYLYFFNGATSAWEAVRS